jgi:DNA-binding MarR family transcriptional regulator
MAFICAPLVSATPFNTISLASYLQRWHTFSVTENEVPEPDAVDRAAGEWAQTWPDLDVSPADVLARINRVSRLLDDAQARQLSGIPGGGIDNLGDFELLRTLRRSGAPYALTPRQLEREMLVSSAGISGRLKRLAAAGWIERVPSVSDRRSVAVQLSETGLRRLDEYLPQHYDFERELIASVKKDEAHLVRALRRLMATLEAKP